MVAATPLNATVSSLRVPLNPVPVIVTDVPTGPAVGLKLEMVTGTVIVNEELLVADPLGEVIMIGPVDAPVGTVVTICVSVAEVTLAAVPLKVTVFWPAVGLNPEPVMVTIVPTGPMFGEKVLIAADGETVNAEPLVAEPPVVVTVNDPVVAPEGTVATICVAEAEVTVPAMPLKLTVFCATVELNPVPVIVTEVPIGPVEGAKLVIDTCGATVNTESLVADPFGAVTCIGPVVDPVGTATTS